MNWPELLVMWIVVGLIMLAIAWQQPSARRARSDRLVWAMIVVFVVTCWPVMVAVGASELRKARRDAHR